jgi:predicted nucleotidyltransferase
MALRNKKAYFRGGTVSAKKYFYVLRPILACQWIEQTAKPVPMLFEDLTKKLIKDEKLRAVIETLLKKKKAGYEFEKGPKHETLEVFIGRELTRLENKKIPDRPNKNSVKRLDHFFRQILNEIWSDRA